MKPKSTLLGVSLSDASMEDTTYVNALPTLTGIPAQCFQLKKKTLGKSGDEKVGTR